MSIKRYSELIRLPTLEERYEYLRFRSVVGQDTFGFDRWMNQKFYLSTEWKRVRREIIVRDECCDLGIKDYPIYGPVFIHHLNPLTPEDIIESTEFLMNPEYLICCSSQTHRAIHFGDKNMLPQPPIERTPYDTCPWKH